MCETHPTGHAFPDALKRFEEPHEDRHDPRVRGHHRGGLAKHSRDCHRGPGGQWGGGPGAWSWPSPPSWDRAAASRARTLVGSVRAHCERCGPGPEQEAFGDRGAERWALAQLRGRKVTSGRPAACRASSVLWVAWSSVMARPEIQKGRNLSGAVSPGRGSKFRGSGRLDLCAEARGPLEAAAAAPRSPARRRPSGRQPSARPGPSPGRQGGACSLRGRASAGRGWKPLRPARPGEGTACPGSLAHTQPGDKGPIHDPRPAPAATRIRPAEGTRWDARVAPAPPPSPFHFAKGRVVWPPQHVSRDRPPPASRPGPAACPFPGAALPAPAASREDHSCVQHTEPRQPGLRLQVPAPPTQVWTPATPRPPPNSSFFGFFNHNYYFQNNPNPTTSRYCPYALPRAASEQRGATWGG